MTYPAGFWNNDTVREAERESIRTFVESCSEHLTGRVLDVGCGRQPYRAVVEKAGGDYRGYDRAGYPGNVSGRNHGAFWGGEEWDAILCTQVLQYVPDPLALLADFREVLAPRHGHLILTYVTNWAEVEPTDLHRHTRAGMGLYLAEAGFEVLRNESRAAIDLGGFLLSLGGGALARA